MRALDGIDVAFLPMNLPYTMTVEQAATPSPPSRPAVVYPYHYGASDIDAFAGLVAESRGAADRGGAARLVRRTPDAATPRRAFRVPPRRRRARSAP